MATYALVSVANGTAPACPVPVTGTAIITVAPIPTATISGATTVCSGSGANITITGTPGAVVTYTINGGANQTANIGAGGTVVIPSGNLTANAPYALVSVANGTAPACPVPVTGTAIITVAPIPMATMSGATTVCSGSGADITITGTPGAVVTYTINGGANQTATIGAGGTVVIPSGNLTANAT